MRYRIAEYAPRKRIDQCLELVQGECGLHVAPAPFLPALRGICDRHCIVMIADEIQSVFARTGQLFAIQYAGVEADPVTMAKSLAGGFPLSVFTGKAALIVKAAPGGLGGAYAGSPIACAAALEVLDVISEEALCERAQALGRQLPVRLQAMAESRALAGTIG